MNTYRWQGENSDLRTIISEPDRNVRYARLAGDFAASVKAGEESVAQVSGVREQAILTQAIRSELKTQGVLGHPEVTMTALSLGLAGQPEPLSAGYVPSGDGDGAVEPGDTQS